MHEVGLDELRHRRYRGPAGPAEPLSGGGLTSGVVRVGDTVRRPHQRQSLAVAAYLDHLETAGFDGSPRYLGRDEQGRDVLTYLPGEVPGNPAAAWAADEGLLASVAVLLNRLNEASAGYRAGSGFTAPAGSVWLRDQVALDPLPREPEPELISHGDFNPANVVVGDGVAVGLIDFDLAGPTTHLGSVCSAAMHWIPLCATEDLWPGWEHLDRFTRMRTFADAYGLTADDRKAIIGRGVGQIEVAVRRMGALAEQAGGGWQRLWDRDIAGWLLRHCAWMQANEQRLIAAME